MKGGQIYPLPQKILPSKIPALLGLNEQLDAFLNVKQQK